ncbi:MAG: sulfotransferase [Bacteroidales bacterium]|nr:sulfotransferase [Bacteroidales bacterium]MCF6342536.1 sulfotransferase [Bacteroidales bacterium]
MKKKTKFLIFGQGRSGSNLLVDLLNSHPDIHCDRELFNENSIKGKDVFRRKLIKSFPGYYIHHQTNKYPEKLYGFKLLTYQLANFPAIRSKLFNHEWKIIHIRRKDVLAQTLSDIVALKTGKYVRKQKDKADNKIFTIDPQDVVSMINIKMNDMEFELELLKGLNYLEIIYENDLANSSKWNESAKGIFRHLGIRPVEVSGTTLKTDNRSNKERISNYADILRYMRKNGLSHLLEADNI